MNILFLGYGRDKTSLISFLEERGCYVTHMSDFVDRHDVFAYDLAVSFGYRHILRQSFLDSLKRPSINLHMSLLPYNRGAHPNFWAWYDGTPHGVTIHHIDSGVDTGDIVAQEQVSFAHNGISFKESYNKLFGALERLFQKNWSAIAAQSYVCRRQEGMGSFHRKRDLPDGIDWDMPVNSVLEKLKGE